MFVSDNSLIVGVDGGGTGCRAAVGTCTDGILAQAVSGAANFTTDPDLALANVESAVNQATAKICASTDALAAATVHIGLAGVMTADDRQRIEQTLPYRIVSVTDDRATSAIGALGSKDGFLLSVGTGTIVASSLSGAFRFVGGWGFSISDQASGAWLGRAALKQVILCHDGLATHTDVTRTLFSKFNDDPNKIATFSMSSAPGDFAKFAPVVIDGAIASDPWGVNIMYKGAAYLTECLMALGFQPGGVICLTGGVGPHYAGYLGGEITRNLAQPIGSALDGAFQLACQNFEKKT